MSPTQKRRLAWLAIFGLACLPVWIDSAVHADPKRSLSMHLLGPLARPLSFAQWVRVHLAIRAGRTDLTLARSETAIALDPSATQGFVALAQHLAFDLASPEREPDAARRTAWRAAALETCARGELTAADPASLALWQGLILAHAAELDPDAPWPGGMRALWSTALEHFERAARLGSPDATHVAERARAVLAELPLD